MQNPLTEKQIAQEWQLIQAAQQDSRQFEALYNSYYEKVFRFIYRRTADENVSADVCSQVFLKALQNLSKYVHRGVPFSAWLFRIASNEVAQYYRVQAKSRVVSVDQYGIKGLGEEINSGEEDSQIPDIQEVMRMLDSLPPKDVELIELRFFEQHSYKEIAHILNITESNAKVRTYRLLERLKKRMLNA